MYSFLVNSDNYSKNGNILYENSTGFEAIKTNFPVDGHDVYDEIEDNSFWFSHRIRCVSEIIKRYLQPGSQILDLGGGNGYNTKHLENMDFDAILMEPSLSGCKNAQKKGVKKIILSLLTNENVKNSSIENITMFDVLECVPNDKELLGTVYEKLKISGHLVIVVPAFSALWSQEDVDIGNVRRFSKKRTEEMLKEIGFTVEYSNYLFQFLFLPILFIRALKDKIFKHTYNNYEEKTKVINRQHNTQKKGLINSVVELLCNKEYKKIKKNKKISYGSSIIIVAKK